MWGFGQKFKESFSVLYALCLGVLGLPDQDDHVHRLFQSLRAALITKNITNFEN